MISIVGLVSATKGKIGQGLLTAWTPEEEVLCEFLGEGPQSLHDFCSLQLGWLFAALSKHIVRKDSPLTCGRQAK